MTHDNYAEDNMLYLRNCPDSGKICLSKKDAQTKKNYIENKGRERELRIYQCEVCSWWHLTKTGFTTQKIYDKNAQKDYDKRMYK